jgi:hypothetical protein
MAGGYAGVKEQEEGENGKKLKRIWSWRFIALIGAVERKGEVEEAGRRGGDYGGRAAEQRKGRGCGRKEELTGGVGVSVTAGEKRKGKDRWATMGGGGLGRKEKWAERELGLGGLKGSGVRLRVFLLFLKPFQT